MTRGRRMGTGCWIPKRPIRSLVIALAILLTVPPFPLPRAQQPPPPPQAPRPPAPPTQAQPPQAAPPQAQTAVQAGVARADRGADRALPGCAGGADDDGIDVSARGHPGGPAREGQPEPQGHSPQRRAEEVRLGRQREVVVQLSADSQPAERKDRLDAEARRSLPRSQER